MKIKLHKKAQVEGATSVKNIVLWAIVFFILAIIVFIYFARLGSEELKENECLLSITKADAARRATLGFSKLGMQANCKRVKEEITLNDVKDKDGKIDEQKLNSLLALKMYECAKDTGKGQLTPFKDYDSSNNYCLICSTLTFEEDLIKKMNTEGVEVTRGEVLEHFALDDVPGQPITLYKYITGYEATIEQLAEWRKDTTAFDLTKQFSVFWQIDFNGLDGTVANVAGGVCAFGDVFLRKIKFGGKLIKKVIGFFKKKRPLMQRARNGGLCVAAHKLIEGTDAVSAYHLLESEILAEPIEDLDDPSKKETFCGVVMN